MSKKAAAAAPGKEQAGTGPATLTPARCLRCGDEVKAERLYVPHRGYLLQWVCPRLGCGYRRVL